MRRTLGLMVLGVAFGAGLGAAAEAPVGTWKTIDEKSGKVVSADRGDIPRRSRTRRAKHGS